MSDSDLIFVATKRERGRVKDLAFWEAKFYVYADGVMYYSARHKYRRRHKWTAWNEPIRRGRVHFPFTQAA